MAAPNMEVFDTYFRRADLDKDGRVSGAEAVAFFQGSNLPKHVLAQIWMHADQNRTGYLGQQEFYNALRLVTVAQSGRELTQDIVKAALFGPAAAKIPAPQINPVPAPAAQINSVTTPTPQIGSMVPPSTQMGGVTPPSQNVGFRGPQVLPNAGQQILPTSGSHFMRPPQATGAAALPAVQGVNQGPSGAGNMAGPRLPSSNTPNLSTDWLGNSISGALNRGTSQMPTRGVSPPVNQGGLGLVPSGATPGLPPRPQAPSPPATSGPLKPIDPVTASLQPAVKDSKALVVSGNGFSSDPVFGGDLFSAAPQTQPDAPTSMISTGTMPTVSSIASVTAGSQNSIKHGQLDPLQSIPHRPLGGSQSQQPQPTVKQNQLNMMQNTSSLTASQIPFGPATSADSQSPLQWPRITHSDIQKYTAVFVEVDKDRDGKITGEQARNLFLSWRLPREVLKQVWDLSDQDNDSMLSLREFCTALYLMERYREGRPLPAVLPNSLRFDETLLQATGQPSTAYGSSAWQTAPGLLQQGMPGSRPVMPASGMRPPVQISTAPQIDGAVHPLLQKSRVPLPRKDLPNQHNKMEQHVLDSNFQEATEVDNKEVPEVEKILDSREKIEFYRTKMQELVLYKSRCDNRLNEITERASADKREAESLAKKYEEKYKQVADVASKLTVEEATFRHVQERKLELQNAIVKMEQGGSVDGLLQVRADRIQSDLEELEKALNQRCKQHGLHVNSSASIELPFGWQPGIQEGAVDWDEDWDKFEDEGFSIAKDLSVELENVGTPEKSKSPSVWSDKTSVGDVSPVESSSHFNGNAEKPYGEHIAESESAYAHSEDGSARSPPGSPGRSAFESPSREFHSSQFGMHGISPHANDSHSDHGGAESTISGDKYHDEHSWGATFDTNDDVDSVWGFGSKDTGHERNSGNSFFGSGDFGLNPIKVDSPSAASVFEKEKSSFFADSVPSTPLFNSASPSKFNDGFQDHTFDSSSRFDSFSMHDSSGFFPQRESLTRFDSIRSTNDFGHSRGFTSFDDSDPFGSTGPFKSSESHSPRRGSDNWSAF